MGAGETCSGSEILVFREGTRVLTSAALFCVLSGQNAAANLPRRLRLRWAPAHFFVFVWTGLCERSRLFGRAVTQRVKYCSVSAGLLIEGMFYSLPSIIQQPEPARRVYTALKSQKVGDIEKFMTPASQLRRLCSTLNDDNSQRRLISTVEPWKRQDPSAR